MGNIKEAFSELIVDAIERADAEFDDPKRCLRWATRRSARQVKLWTLPLPKEADMDEPKYTKQQAVVAYRKASSRLYDTEYCGGAGENYFIEALDPPARTCRCGRWTWDAETNWWVGVGTSFRGGVTRGVYHVCLSCRCALLEEGRVSEPLFTDTENAKWHEGLGNPSMATWLLTRPISAAPARE